MRIWITVVTLVLFSILAGWSIWGNHVGNQQTSTEQNQGKTSMSLTISSSAFQQNGIIPKLFTCDGRGISPALFFNNIPEGTQSLALVMEDPDVPKSIREDGMWNHWIAWNIPPETKGINEGESAPGVIGINTGGRIGYGAPCPPDREHRYIFTLYALDSTISLPEGSTKEELLPLIAPHIIETAQLIGRYNRH